LNASIGAQHGATGQPFNRNVLCISRSRRGSANAVVPRRESVDEAVTFIGFDD